jgi:D-alanyl-D-alanine carboxypeptidase
MIAGVVASLLPLLANPAQAHYRHHYRHFAHYGRHSHIRFASRRHHASRFAERAPSSHLAEIVVDANTGRVLYAENENDLRHPASITKVMTLYLLFKELDRGRLHLNSRLTISAHAAAQAPTKLGLRPGQTIDIDDAIKAVVTKSANDIAVAIAETIGGSESNFCAMMTREAHALGMTHTHYADASGLPNDAQITTAADLAILGRAIQQRFPRYFHYFSIEEFAYHGERIRNHNHLLGRIPGMDGIKTGYTRASGFNLLTSVHYKGRAIVAVVLGGVTAASRDRAMAALIDNEIGDASIHRTALMIAEVAKERGLRRAASSDDDEDAAEDDAVPMPPSRPDQSASADDSSGEDSASSSDDSSDDTVGSQEPSGDSWAAKAEALREPDGAGAVPLPVERPQPAYVASAPVSAESETTSSTRRDLDGSTRADNNGTATTPSALHWVKGPEPVADAGSGISDGQLAAAGIAVKQESRAEDDQVEAPQDLPSGWMIQIGATDDAAKADALLARAKARRLSVLDDAKPFTQKVKKGDATLYRARFAGLAEDDAQLACRSLKRSGFACFAMKN